MDNNTKWVFLTGGTRGIGRAIVEILVNNGYDVIFTYQSSDIIAQEISSSLTNNAARAYGYKCNAGSYSETERLSKELLLKYGAPYAVICNAGSTNDSAIMNMTPHQWDSVINSNLTSAYNITNCFIRSMIEKSDGCILYISSVSAFHGNIGQANYSASKAGLIGFMKSVSKEAARFNIRTNVIAPGYIDTDMTDGIPDTIKDKIIKTIPLKRYGQSSEVAFLVMSLMNEGCSYVTGQTFVIDGGLSS